ncbi:hypothetical protein [Los Azufres archaeal virus 1]|nr:hypothetical protein [Los Azufres archaeal virus 1]
MRSICFKVDDGDHELFKSYADRLKKEWGVKKDDILPLLIRMDARVGIIDAIEYARLVARANNITISQAFLENYLAKNIPNLRPIAEEFVLKTKTNSFLALL